MPAAELRDEARLAAAALLSCGALECEIIGGLARRRRAPLSLEHAVLLFASAARSSRFLTENEEEKEDCPGAATTTTLTTTTTTTAGTWIQLLCFADRFLGPSLLV